MTIEIKIRPANSFDGRFIHSSWLRSYWKSYAQGRIDWDIYADEHSRRIQELRPHSRCLVAHLEEVPDEILGYSLFNEETCHWVYVKKVYRQRGIGRLLLPHPLKYFSHWPDSGGRTFLTKLGMKFNPYRTSNP